MEVMSIVLASDTLGAFGFATKKLIINAKNIDLTVGEQGEGVYKQRTQGLLLAYNHGSRTYMSVDIKEGVTTVNLQGLVPDERPKVLLQLPESSGLKNGYYNLSIRAENCGFSFNVGCGYAIDTANIHLTDCTKLDKWCAGILIGGKLYVRKSFIVHYTENERIEIDMPNIGSINVKRRKKRRLVKN